MTTPRVQVGIVGAGPAGLMLAHLLARAGVSATVLEQRSRATVEGTVRAGVLEQGTVDLLQAQGLGARMQREGAVHDGVELRFEDARCRIPLTELTDGRAITLYAQHEVLKDLLAAREAVEALPLFEATVMGVVDETGSPARIHYTQGGQQLALDCDFVVGADGYHGPVRRHIPEAVRQETQRQWPFAWFGILLDAPRISPELIYARHARGFALASTRSAQLQRLYLQVPPDTRPDDLSGETIIEELAARLDLPRDWCAGPSAIRQRDVVGMRSFVCQTLRHGRLILAGDAAHIVPPTGAKGLNLAMHDVRLLADALIQHFGSGDDEALQHYPARALARVWQAQRFSWWMTSCFHRLDGEDAFDVGLKRAGFMQLVESRAAAAAFARDYVG